jgi:hypothetical protein
MTPPVDPFSNPFAVTKAVDFSDQQIQATWVDFSADGGFFALADPTSPMPRILLGGKGSGRTHLMRYFSAPLQRLRHEDDLAAALQQERFLGIYLRASGLNAGRFQGKGIEADVWDDTFAYSLDLWLAQLTLATVGGLIGDAGDDAGRAIARDVSDAFDHYAGPPPSSIAELATHLQSLQRELDLAINNAALRRRLDLVIPFSRGRLPFVLPRSCAANVPALRTVSWLYLIDELENFTVQQQRYVQTLIREKESPTSFIVGSRLYGFRTRETYSAGEENREGSEYEAVYLDWTYSRNFTPFRTFCRELVAQRLIEADVSKLSRDELVRKLPGYFAHYPQSRLGEHDCDFIPRNETERKYFAVLRRQLVDFGETDANGADRIIDDLGVSDSPLLERLNVHLLYQSWGARRDLREASTDIATRCSNYLDGTETHGTSGRGRYAEALSKYRNDLMAQLLHQYGQSQRYLGLDAYIRMAGGLPRNLVIILKNVVRWSVFNGEVPFGPKPISQKSQRAGVTEAADWFFEDATPMGDEGEQARDAITRLANLLRALRFADKPPESSLSTFSVDLASVTPEARERIGIAEEWSLLIPVLGGQKDRNSGGRTDKFQLNPMLCPLWDLPLVRRGAIALSSDEANAVFAPPDTGVYDEVVRIRVSRANAPFREGAAVAASEDQQGTLL